MIRPAPLLSVLLPAHFARFSAWARAEQAYQSFVGRYQWNEAASSYSAPHECGTNPPRFFEIFHDGPWGIKLRKRVVMQDGISIDWRHDVTYDGKPGSDGSITWKMTRLTPDSIGNEWYTNDGSFKGYEVARITGARITNTGVQIDAEGNMYPYVEVWDRAQDQAGERHPNLAQN
jgi:hypothetical protein